jgi:hypothetical protein
MSPYRASDEAIDREIAALERIARVRIGRATRELREIDRDLRELRRERARRIGAVSEGTPAEAANGEASDSAA